MKRRIFATMATVAALVVSVMVGFLVQAEEAQKSTPPKHTPTVQKAAALGDDDDQHLETNLFPEYGDNAPSEKLYASLYLLKGSDTPQLPVETMKIGEVYTVHVPVYWLAEGGRDLENVSVKVGFWSQDEQTAHLTLHVKTGEEALVDYDYEFGVTNDSAEDYWYTLENVGPAKLYNNGHLNGAQVNHADLLWRDKGILIGYDDQDGLLPSGKEFGCELVFKIQLTEVEPKLDNDPPSTPQR